MLWNERLAMMRKELGKSQEQVVREMALYLPQGETVSVGALSSWEVGRTQPKIHHALALAKVLNDMDVSSLFATGSLCGGLNDDGLFMLAEYRRLLLESPRFRVQPPPSQRRTIPIYLQAASAGTGQFLDDEASRGDGSGRIGAGQRPVWRAAGGRFHDAPLCGRADCVGPPARHGRERRNHPVLLRRPELLQEAPRPGRPAGTGIPESPVPAHPGAAGGGIPHFRRGGRLNVGKGG